MTDIVKEDSVPVNTLTEQMTVVIDEKNLDPCDNSSSSGNQEKKRAAHRRAKRGKKSTAEQKTSKSKSADQIQESLSADALAFIQGIQQRSTEIKTGPISIADLMGEKQHGSSILDRLLEKPLTAFSLLNVTSERPPIPGLSNTLPRNKQGVRPEILRNAMSILQGSSSDFHSRRASSSPSRGTRTADGRMKQAERLPPWISLAPMYPLEERFSRSQQMTSPRSKNGVPLHKSHSNHSAQRLDSPNASGANQKARKPYFVPYMSGELVSRGLAAKELIKGTLRVNQKNYEESYIDNPDGNDQLDLLIYGLQDRNRALHGDIVVVRIKHRSQWAVRDNLYQAWRRGDLKISCDDDGKPLTVPPVPVPKDDNIVELALGGTAEVKIRKDQVNRPVPVSENAKYSREDMLLMGAQSELRRQKIQTKEDQGGAPDIDANLEEKISNLALKRIEVSDPAVASATSKNNLSKKPAGQKKLGVHLLSDMPDEDWGMPDCCLQKTAEVVFIAEPKNCRAAMGQLKIMNDLNKNWALFSPTDSRMPRMMIPAEQLPVGFFDRPQDFLKFVFVARLVDWQATNQFARGRLERSLGIAGDPEVETEGLLFANNVDSREFSPSTLKSLPVSSEEQWTIPEQELASRRDFRGEIVFTIDPLTARDLDDALHIKPCDDVDGAGKPGWEVGVHIADVTYFLKENTELDEWAAQRATSVYLVHKVVPMLPRILCEELCSLNSGVDRLTFSVVWKIDDEGNVYSNDFMRSVIRSKVKLAYEHAQDFIEHPDKEFGVNEVPEIFDGIDVQTIKEKVLQLNAVALKLRAKRAENGALRLDQPKLKFALDDTTKMPNGVSVYEIKDANRLVEEFMLLANMAVARRIEEAYPNTALLRRHPPPKQKVLREVLEICEKIGFPLDATSSGLLSSSLNKYIGDSQLMRSINQVLSMLMMKPMQLAQYFCVGMMNSKSDYAHYALACPYYTHFTSPIRRYPDVMVHRFLAASLGYSQPPNMSIQEIQKLAEHCNDKKLAAKTVSEGSDDTFFGLFVRACGPINERGVVVNVLDAAFDVLVFKYGVIKRVYINKLNMAREPIYVEGPPSKLILFWNTEDSGAVMEQPIQMCTVVDVELSKLESTENQKYQAVIKPGSSKDTKTLRQLLKEGKSLDDKLTDEE